MSDSHDPSREQLRAEVEDLRARIDEAEDTLRAIRSGEVDALVVSGEHGSRLFTLKDAQEPYRLLVEEMDQGAVMLSEDGVILYSNRRFAETVHASIERVIGGDFAAFVTPEHRPRFLQLLAAGRAGRSGGELAAQAADGAGVPLYLALNPLTTGAVVMVCGVATDLTGQKRREEEFDRHVAERTAALTKANRDLIAARAATINMMQDTVEAKGQLEKANEDLRREMAERAQAEDLHARLATVVEQATESIMITDTDGVIQYVNRAFEKTTGYTRQEAVGQNARLLKSGKQDAAFYKAMWDTLTRGEAWNGHFINKRKDGTFYEVDRGIFPVRDAAGRVVSYVALGRDVTREAQLEAQLRQAQKMEAVGRLAGGVAHDFNNLLTAINGYSEMTLKALPADDPLVRNIEEIRAAGERAAALTRQLLAFSRKQVLQPRVLNLNELVANLSKMLCRLIGEDIHLTATFAPGAGRVKADPGQLEQVITNLAVNARDAMPDGGTLTLQTADAELDEAYCRGHADATPGRYVMLAMSDTGTGMTDEVKRHLFEPFFTTKEQGKGTGLGLAMIYGIVKQSGGHISVYSEVGHGTAFKIYLPRVEEAATATTAIKAPVEFPRGSETILLVEDEEQVRKLACTILEECGYTVLNAASGAEAVGIAKRLDGKVNLLLTDMIMPGINGRVLAQSLLRTHPAMKCLFMSGYTDTHILPRDLLSTGAGFLQKPFAAEALARKVRELLDKRDEGRGGGGE